MYVLLVYLFCVSLFGSRFAVCADRVCRSHASCLYSIYIYVYMCVFADRIFVCVFADCADCVLRIVCLFFVLLLYIFVLFLFVCVCCVLCVVCCRVLCVVVCCVLCVVSRAL